MNWSMLPLGLFGVLNIFLAFTARQRVSRSAGVTTVFGLAAVLIGAGLWQSNPLLVVLGLICSLDAPMRMGQLLHGRINWRHVLTRLLVIALFFLLWLNFRPA